MEIMYVLDASKEGTWHQIAQINGLQTTTTLLGETRTPEGEAKIIMLAKREMHASTP